MAIKGTYKRSLLILIGDIFILPFSYLAGYYLRFGSLAKFGERLPLSFLLLMATSYLVIFYFFDLYESKKKYFAVNSLAKLLFGVIIGGITISFLKYGLFLQPIGRGIFILANLISWSI